MNENMKLQKGIPVKFGAIEGTIYGGPFVRYVPGTRRLVGVKMAVEINHPHDFKVDTEDYSVPTQEAMQEGVMYAIDQLSKGKDVYAGCRGGIGRTGLFMACIASVMLDYTDATGSYPLVQFDPVGYVRYHYFPHAVETKGQKAFVKEFNTEPAVSWLIKHNDLLNGSVKVETVIQDRIVYLGPVSWAVHLLLKMFKFTN